MQEQRRSSRRRAGFLVATVVALALAAAGLPPAPPAPAAATTASQVIVQASHLPSAVVAVRAAGGRITYPLPLVDGFLAEVPAGALPALRASPGVRAVTPNRPVHVAATTSETGTFKPVVLEEIGADKLHAEGIDGEWKDGERYATVALIDTGVTQDTNGDGKVDSGDDLHGRIVPVADALDPDNPEKKVACVNFSGEVDLSPDSGKIGRPNCADQFGHGTAMAALIAGTGGKVAGVKGVAPRARILSLKIAGADGSSDVSKVLAALQWVWRHKHDYGIDVVNLSLGTDSNRDWKKDPLNLAVERVWKRGITVVVAAGNRGPGTSTMSKPADDPWVVTVSASDDRQTKAIDDDRIPRFTSRGPTAGGHVKPDVVAPGARVVTVLPKGSYLRERLKDKTPLYPAFPWYWRASGTSAAAAITSGAVALLVEASQGRTPAWDPDQMKFALRNTARKVAVSDPNVIGRGLVSVYDASGAIHYSKHPHGNPNAGLATSNGLGDEKGVLDPSRGTVAVTAVCNALRQSESACGKRLVGEVTAQGRAYDSKEYADASAWEKAWPQTQWGETPYLSGTSWYGTSWYGTSWYGTSWYSCQPGDENCTNWHTYEPAPGSQWDGNLEAQTSYGAALIAAGIYGLWE